MSVYVATVIDHERGCGWRKEGGIYMMAVGVGSPCGKLPFPITACPVCNCGIKPARGFTWWNPRPFVEKIECKHAEKDCSGCPLSKDLIPTKAGLLWIGEKFYANPQKWTNEANSLGVSRRLSRIPNGFKLGETWVFVAHRKAIPQFDKKNKNGETICIPGVFHAFKPNRFEYITNGKETEEELEALVKRGITPVKVKRAGQLNLDITE